MVRKILFEHIVTRDDPDPDPDGRLNTKLESKGLEPMTDLVRDFANGVKLIQVSDDSTSNTDNLVSLTDCLIADLLIFILSVIGEYEMTQLVVVVL